MAAVAAMITVATAVLSAQAAPQRSYFALVTSAGVDQVTLLHFGPGGAAVDHRTYLSVMAEIAGPRALDITPDRRAYVVTTTRGAAFGAVIEAVIADTVDRRLQQPTDVLVGREAVGAAPTAVRVSHDGHYAWVTNFGTGSDVHTAGVAVIDLALMLEAARITTCNHALGAAFSPDGAHHYSACLTDDALVDIDARAMHVARYFTLAPGAERGADHLEANPAAKPTCAPRAVSVSDDGSQLFVACSASADVVVIDVAHWTMVRRIAMGPGLSDVVVTHDGKLVIGANRLDESVSIADVATGHEVARVPVSRRLPGGLAVTDDDRYLFVSSEGVGGEPGAVDVIDLASQKPVASVDVGMQAGGVEFWHSVPARPATARP
jgi:DNA-binding beta-propeller fold protein YncE